LGDAVAVAVATYRPAAGFILESTFTPARDFAEFHYPFRPVRYLLKIQLNSIAKISKIRVPLLVIHGTQNGIVPLQFGNEPKMFYEITNADHNDTYVVGGAAFVQRVRSFVLNNLPALH
jgi:fermentation-respiration switch protein FrsA (DUF1100 family)